LALGERRTTKDDTKITRCHPILLAAQTNAEIDVSKDSEKTPMKLTDEDGSSMFSTYSNVRLASYLPAPAMWNASPPDP